MRDLSKLHLGALAVAGCSLLQACWDYGSSSSSLPHAGEASGGTTFSSQGSIDVTGGASDPVVVASPLFRGDASRAKSTTPVVGGTLLVTADGRTIAAADPGRDAVFLVDAASHQVTKIALLAGDEPGRIAEGAPGTLYVALRRAGALVAVDLARKSVTVRTLVCAAPRGIAYDAASAAVYVACRSGLLLTLDSASLAVRRSIQLDSDLRDVIVRAHDLVVTRFLSAEVMVVAPDGTVLRRANPNPEPGCATATVMFRALSLPSGQIALAHQASSDQEVGVEPGGYGFSCGGALVRRFLSFVDVDTATPTPLSSAGQSSAGQSGRDTEGDVLVSSMLFNSGALPAAGPLDIAVDSTGKRFAAIALDDSLSPTSVTENGSDSASLWVFPWDPQMPQPDALSGQASLFGIAIHGQPVAVAFSPSDGTYVVQSREPATLEFEDGASVSLSDESHADIGHRMFHMDAGIGISCSSCHPEGGEDGHVWHFVEGLRRTLPLQGGVLERAPFHWDGTLADMGALVNEVMLKRMNLQAQPSDAQVAGLGSFLEQLPLPAATDGLDAAAVNRGEALFRRDDVGCAQCHSGPQYTNNMLTDVGTGGMFVTPSLLGVGLRNALFHDGCAKSVAERFGPCGGSKHGNPALLSQAEQADLIEFMRSL